MILGILCNIWRAFVLACAAVWFLPDLGVSVPENSWSLSYVALVSYQLISSRVPMTEKEIEIDGEYVFLWTFTHFFVTTITLITLSVARYLFF